MHALWFDDNREFVDTASGWLRELGNTVDPVSDWETAQKYCETEDYDLIIVDWDLGEARTGTDFFRLLEVESLQPAAEWRLASYHYHAEGHQGDTVPEASLPLKVRPVSIDAHVATLESFEKLLLPQLEGSLDPTATSFGAYAALSVPAKIELIDAVYSAYHESIEERLTQRVWFLACGPNCDVVASATSAAQIYTDAEIWQLAEEIGYAPFQFFADETVEDCAGDQRADLGDYPSVTLDLDDVKGDELRQIHYDTGKQLSELDAEALEGSHPVRAVGRQTKRSHSAIWSVHPTTRGVSGTLHCQVETDNSLPVEFRVIVSADWSAGRLARKCIEHQCPAPQEGGVCRYRTGLIGRNLQTETGVTIALVPVGEQDARLLTRVEGKPDQSQGWLSRLGRS